MTIGDHDEPFIAITIEPGGARAVVTPTHSARLCDGHFPDAPLLPGAALVGLMARLGGHLLKPGCGDLPPLTLRRCVFAAPVTPRDTITVVARPHADNAHVIEAEVHTAAGCAARATIVFAPPQ